LNIYPEVQLLDHMNILYLIFLESCCTLLAFFYLLSLIRVVQLGPGGNLPHFGTIMICITF
jgi:hypothetical protein